MRYFKFCGGTPFCGCDFEQYECFKDEKVNESFLDNYASDLAADNAAMYEDIEHDYGVEKEDYASDEDFQTALEEYSDEYYGESYCDWEEVTREVFLENGGEEK